MDRRTVLAGIGMTAVGSAGIATALGAFDERAPYRLRVTPATGNETDASCDLPSRVVAAHAPLADLLERARTADTDEPVSREIPAGVAATLRSDLEAACEETGGIYVVDGDSVFIRIQATDPSDTHDHSGQDGHDGHSH